MKKIEIFAPDDIEFDFSSLGLKSYFMPGDIPTKKVIKLLALHKRYRKIESDEKEDEIIKEMTNHACSFFEDRHSKKELEELKSKLGFSTLMQLITGINQTMVESGEDIKNLRNRAKKKARK